MDWHALALASVLSAAGCGNGTTPPPPVCAEYEVPASTDLTQPAVHFRADIVPLLNQSCTFVSCHGNPGGGSSGLFLGTNDGKSDPSLVRSGLVGVAAPELPSMPLVVAANPKGSFVMRKLDGDHCLLDASCKDKSCGEAMPRTGELLPVADRDKVRRWIAQGAKDD